ncbi:MAG: hypothetical protein OXG35_27485 [Acidobacteria bacterium]|nr:hypothetical protein [Acidobacteriota bacterium]
MTKTTDTLVEMVGQEVVVHTTARPTGDGWCGRLTRVDPAFGTITVYVDGEIRVFPLSNIEVVVRHGEPDRGA